MLDVDNVDLTTIVGNIIDNAFDAVLMNQDIMKKIVSLLIYEDNGEICISITNNGPQILDVHMKRIFDYKYSTKVKDSSDRGYGLFIVQELVTRNNGKVTFQSTEQETEFLISFSQRKELPEVS